MEISENRDFFSDLVTTKTTWTNITGLAMTNWVNINIKIILGPKLRKKLNRGRLCTSDPIEGPYRVSHSVTSISKWL